MEGLVTFEADLSRFSPADWAAALETLAPEIHPIDREATRVWCAFFPLPLHLALAAAGPDQLSDLERSLGLMGHWRLADQVDSSHTFLYGHRYWPQIKRAVLAVAAKSSFQAGLPEIITRVADHASRTSSVDRDQSLGIAIVGLMTLRQCGTERFGSGNGIVQLPMNVQAKSIRQVRRRRRRQTSRGLWGFLRGRGQRFRMTFDEGTRGASFDVIAGQDIASGAPVGTSWIGVLAGADRLSPIDPSAEGQQLAVLGYTQANAANGAPLIRLASGARPTGDVTFVIPPWSGTIGTLI